MSLYNSACRSVSVRITGQACRAYLRVSFSTTCICFCASVCTRPAGIVASALTDRWDDLKTADGCLAPEVLLASLFLLSIPVSLLGRPPSLPALISLSEGLWQKREPDSWHGAEVEPRKEQEDSGGCIPAALHSEKAASCCAMCFVSDKLAVCLPPVTWQHLPYKQPTCFHTHEEEPLPMWPQRTLCGLPHATADNIETRRRDRQKELWRHLLQRVNNMLAVCKAREQVEWREGASANGGSNLRVMKAWFMARDCLLSSFLLSQFDDAPGALLLLSHLEPTGEQTPHYSFPPAPPFSWFLLSCLIFSWVILRDHSDHPRSLFSLSLLSV